VDAAALCIGQEFVKEGNVPGWVGELVLTAAAKVFSSSAHVDVHTRLPYFMNPVLAACQVRVCPVLGAAGRLLCSFIHDYPAGNIVTCTRPPHPTHPSDPSIIQPNPTHHPTADGEHLPR